MWGDSYSLYMCYRTVSLLALRAHLIWAIYNKFASQMIYWNLIFLMHDWTLIVWNNNGLTFVIVLGPPSLCCFWVLGRWCRLILSPSLASVCLCFPFCVNILSYSAKKKKKKERLSIITGPSIPKCGLQVAQLGQTRIRLACWLARLK